MSLHLLLAFISTLIACTSVSWGFMPEADLFHQNLLTHLNFPDHEFLDVMELRHRSKRHDSPDVDKEIEFSAMGRHFHLLLQENTDVISAGFRVFTEDADGAKRRFHGFDPHEYYAGRVAGAPNSMVSAHVDSGTGLLTASIAQDSDMYFIEPVTKSENGNSTTTNTMIVYKVDEAELALESERHRLHDSITLNESVPYDPSLQNMAGQQKGHHSNQYSQRSKRQANEVESRPTRCALRLVADHHFFKEHGSDVKQTINYLVTVIDRINQIYLPTQWSEDDKSLSGFGFVVQEIHVHVAPTPDDGHYNSVRSWTIRQVLDAFSKERDHKWFCLSHLFTHQRFESGVLGLAFVANLRKFVPGGICSQAVAKGDHTYYYNTGVTTTQNSFGKAIFTRITDLITAHEFGHNWGAEHDPDLAECSPASGGGYIMHTYSLAGYDRNNKLFSPCSKRSITEVLRYKSLSCFISNRKSFCGNGVVDEGEECDSQQLAGQDNDPCCTSECRLRVTAKCSDFNHFCCQNCAVKQYGSLCREGNVNDCKKTTVCDGLSAHCPLLAPPVEDNVQCVDQGRCSNGTCVPFCESIGLQSCLCRQEGQHCDRCCRTPHTNSNCHPHEPRQRLVDGTPCAFGFCERGKCMKKTQDVVTRIWHFVDHGSVSRFVKFMRDNIVFAVLVTVLLIFMPVWYYTKNLDQKVLAQEKERQPLNDSPGQEWSRSGQEPHSGGDTRSVEADEVDGPQAV